MILLIPAFQPDEKLTQLIRAARHADANLEVVVVDDGSGPQYSRVFDAAQAAGALVVGYRVNKGKGFALKTGIRLIRDNFPGHDVVCADCDGQHAIDDILRVAERVQIASGAMVLGIRNLTGDIPIRSRLGNAVSRQLFRLSTGRALRDTQTGLRGYPADLLGWVLSVSGDRYEFEFNLLLEACRASRPIDTIQIETIYLAENASSHFRPLADSVRIYAPLLKFGLSSLGAFIIDAVLVLLLTAMTGSLLTAVIGARVISSATNFAINRDLVFKYGRERSLKAEAAGYFALAAGLVVVNYLALECLTSIGLPLLPAKILTDLGLFLISYAVQTQLLFAGRRRRSEPTSERVRAR